MHIPSEHHDCGLRISAWGFDERGAVHNAQRGHTKHSVCVVHHFAPDTTAVEVPNGGHSASAPLRHGGRVAHIREVRPVGSLALQELQFRIHQRGDGRHGFVAEILKRWGAQELLQVLHSCAARVDVTRMCVVIELDVGVLGDVRALEAKVSGRDWIVDFHHEECALIYLCSGGGGQIFEEGHYLRMCFGSSLQRGNDVQRADS